MGLVPDIVLAVALGLSPVLASAQQMPMSGAMMMAPSTMMAGIVTAVRYASCRSGSQGCEGIADVTPSPQVAVPGGIGIMMPMPMSRVGQVTGNQPVTVIFIPGTHFMWQGSPFPLTRLKVGDRVVLGYRTLDGMNVVVGGMIVGMSRMSQAHPAAPWRCGCLLGPARLSGGTERNTLLRAGDA